MANAPEEWLKKQFLILNMNSLLTDNILRQFIKSLRNWKVHISIRILLNFMELQKHSRNILIHNGRTKIADIGLEKLKNRSVSIDPTLIERMPYFDPKYFFGSYERNKKSDIYSLGVILWEISSGRPPFQAFRYRYAQALAMQIYKGIREEPIEGTPSQYVDLYRHCWDGNPDIRPEAITILETLNRLIANIELVQCKQSNENFTVNKSLSITTSMGSNIQNEESIPENWLKKAISDRHVNYIEYNKFTNPIVVDDGGFGRVFKYEWKDCELMVALKCLKVDTSIDEKIIKDFIDELKLLQRVSCHPNIITFYGVTKEYANEGTLQEYLKTNFTLLKWTDKLRIAKEIALGLLFLHDKDIIHRDLKSGLYKTKPYKKLQYQMKH
ncbi:kinase-like domain-containing protein [Gigaspora rosea]|uniref:Kinase-like domain-containing protein n=1 Tax=Gigaspora rosea TaxID=44941 RepID=A0A397VAI0_9GLOM|nr:kinase-like domain-containing protein [Gigaspora rosea]